jgi:hypothetical protein
MAEEQTPQGRMDAEEAQRLSEAIDTASGPGPVLDQDAPAPMPLFNQNERTGRDIHSVIDPAEFAELGERSGEELDGVHSIEGRDKLGVAGRAAKSRPDIEPGRASDDG